VLRIQREWQFRDARARLRSVIYEAMASGPQRITRYGEPAVVVLSEADFQLLNSNNHAGYDDVVAAPGFAELDMEHDLPNVGHDLAP
jgi:antitoxin Phd